MPLEKLNKSNFLILLIYFFLFLFFLSKPAIISPDTYSYYHVDISRFPGYIVFLRAFHSVFGDFYDSFIVAFQILFGFLASFIIFKNCIKLFQLNHYLQIVLFIILLVPYFHPLSIGNNVASEGLAYPLYLLFISFSLDFLFKNQQKKLYYLSFTLLLLSLTRGQFIFTSLIVLLVYVFKVKKGFISKKQWLNIVILFLLPLTIQFSDQLFKKLVYGFFIPTQYSYVNAITLPLFVSKISDSLDINNKDNRNLFIMSFHRIDSLGLLSSKVEGSYSNKYKVFHNNFPLICNQNIHDQGRDYFKKIDSRPHVNSILTESACKAIFPILIKNNFKEWFLIYFTGLIHGYKSIFIFLYVILLFLYGSSLIIRHYNIENGILVLASLLVLSNSLIVALASHSIIRYLFYNYFLGFIATIIFIRKITTKND